MLSSDVSSRKNTHIRFVQARSYTAVGLEFNANESMYVKYGVFKQKYTYNKVMN